MTLRNLPAADLQIRPGMQTRAPDSALARWAPDLRAAEHDEDATISILDQIGVDPWTGDGVTAKRVAGALRAIGQRPVTVAINSPGGDMFEGLAIYNLLREHSERVTVKVLGLAASAASVVAMAGDDVVMPRSGFLMVHNSWVLAMGNRHDLREVSEWLEPFDAAMAGIYAARGGMSEAEAAALMDGETWLNGDQAIEKGLADRLLDRDEVANAPDARAARELRAERRVDLLAQQAGLSRAEARGLLRELKSLGKRDAAPEGAPVAADLLAGLGEIRAILKQ